jgi:hypothetical protein
MAYQQNIPIPIRGLRFSAQHIQQIQYLRPTPNFTQYVDDLSPSQRKFIICTHGLSEELNVRDREVVETIRNYLMTDTYVWKQNKTPNYCYFGIDAVTGYQVFLEQMNYVHEGFKSRGIGDRERRFLCSQIESLTDIFYASIPSINKLTFIEQAHYKKEFQKLQTYRDALVNTADFSTTLSNVMNLPDDTQDLSKAIPTSFSTPHTVPTIKPSRLSHIFQPATSATTLSEMVKQTIPEEQVEESIKEMEVDKSNVASSSHTNTLNVSQPLSLTTSTTSIYLVTTTSPDNTEPNVTNTLTTQSINAPITSTFQTHGNSDESAQNIFTDENNVQQTDQQASILLQQDTFTDAFAAMSFGEPYRTCLESDNNDSFENSINRMKNGREMKYEFPKLRQQYSSGNQNRANNLPRQPRSYQNVADGNVQNIDRDNHPYENSFRHVPFINNNNDQNSFPPPNNNSNNVNISDLSELLTRMMSQPRTNSYMPKLNDWYPKFSGSDDCSLIDVLDQWEKMADNCGMSYHVLLSQIQILLRNDALKWHYAIGVDIRDWDSYKTAIINRFQAKEKIVSLFMSNVNEQKHLEKFNTYYARLRMLIKQSGREITERQLVTRLLTGLRDTRCRDVVRNYSSSAQTIDWERIIKNINEIEVEYDLIARSKYNVQLSSEKSKLSPLKWNIKSDFKNLQIQNAEKFVKNSPYFQKEVESIAKPDNNDNKNVIPKFKNFTFNKTPFKQKYNFNKIKSNNKNELSAIESIDYVEPSFETIEEIETNQLMLMNVFEENDWNDENIEEFMSMQTCTNCDETGHILENCAMLKEQNKFRQQCTSCHAPGITTSSCDSCSKN